MNCHTQVRKDSPRLAEVRSSYETGNPIKWVKVHKVGDYAYFNHAAHVSRGIGCATCHGRIDRMEVVYQHSPLSMGWCLSCHRNPEPNLRPVDRVTDMAFNPMADLTAEARAQIKAQFALQPSEHCSTCHR
jgi:hypothetical protein